MKCHCGNYMQRSYWKTESYLTKCPKCGNTGMIEDKPFSEKNKKKVGI
jgi:predicted nucleic-acid-binding Zn-ribbon protein